MKRLLAFVLLLALVGVASATSLNFQNPDDFTQINSTTNYGAGSASWTESGVGGNNYVGVYHNDQYQLSPISYTVFHLVSPSATTYAAATYVGVTGGSSSDPIVVLLDSSKNTIGSYNVAGGSPTGVWEVKITGGVPKYYINGVLVHTEAALSQNPSYIGFGTGSRGDAGTHYWDNYVYGDTENKHVLGISESDDMMFIILDDMINDASDGLAFGINGTQVQATYMPATWSRGNLSTPLTNQTAQLVSYPDNTAYATYYTGDAFSGTINVDIKTYLINAGAFDGYYALYMPGTGKYSNVIVKKSNGATVSFNSETYSTNDLATMTYSVASGGYWDSAYSYKLSVYGLSDGYVVNNTISTQTGSFTQAWSSSNTPGVYYAILYATQRSTGKEYILGLDWATLSSYVNFNGYVNNAQNETIISGANVSMTQDGAVCNTLSSTDGTYNCTGFSTGALWYVNATAAGFRQYTFNATPLAAKGVALNISLEPIAPVSSGIAVGGCDRDTTYGRPIKDALVTVRNITSGLYCYKTTSMTGWYLNDETDCLFQSKTPYDVWAYKTGYSNSTTELVVTK